MAKSVAQPRMNSFLFATFAALALLLAAVGIYGVISYSVTQRQREIGIRMALGARPSSVLMMVVREGGILACLGIAIGAGAAFYASHLLRALLFAVSSTDATTFSEAALLLLVVALGACYVPARRAARVDPMAALRRE